MSGQYVERMYRRIAAAREHTPYGSILCIYIPRKEFMSFKRDARDYYQPLYNVSPLAPRDPGDKVETRELDEILFAGAYIFPLDEERESEDA
jgi:hypothetical protein